MLGGNIDLHAPLDNAKYVGGMIKEGGEVVLTSLNDNAKIVGEKLKEGGGVVLTTLKSDFNELGGDLINEFSAFDMHYQAGETTCQMLWRLWLLVFLGVNAAIIIFATIYIFAKGGCKYSLFYIIYLCYYIIY